MKLRTRRPLRGKGPADQLAAAAGVDLREVARWWPTARPRCSAEEIDNRVIYIRHAARVGGLNDASAAELAFHLKCDPGIFIWGLSPQQGANVNTRRAGRRGKGLGSPRRSNAGRRASPSVRPQLRLV